jgi:hypothetical protein
MEGTSHPSDRIRKVERSFEWSRLESQVMTSAYEQVCPIIRLRGGLDQCPDLGASDTTVNTHQRQAAGA